MLFGHQNDDNTQAAGTPPPPPTDPATPPADGANPLAVDPATGASLPVAPIEPASEPAPEVSALDQPAVDTPAAPPAIEPATVPQTETEAPDEPAAEPTRAPADDELLGLKQQALAQLSPLVSQLDQTPEEKFRTTMMLLQSTDNSTLIKDAYEAAQSIPDEKARAQALLDVVNEINYFTHQKTADS